MNINQTIKKPFSRAAMLLLATILFSMTAQPAWAKATVSFPTSSGGSGTSTDPYKISSKEDLKKLADDVSSGTNYDGVYFIMTQNFTYDKNTENNFTPIGTGSNSFYGNFDGNGKTISGVNINLPETEYVGIFGRSYTANIKRLTLTNSTITGKDRVGGILGSGCYNNAIYQNIIQNCVVTSTVTVSGNKYVGGIAGERCIVRGCSCAATVKGCDDYVGGIVGIGEFTTIEYCIYTGGSVTITTANRYKVGAIVGDIGYGNMTANYYTQANVGGCNRGDRNGARKACTVTLPANVVPSGAAKTYDVSGITAYPGNNIILYNNTYYAGARENVTLRYTGNDLADGYAARYKVKNGDDSNGNTITMPAADVIIERTTSAFVWGVKGVNDGSKTNPYTITTTEGLDLLSQKVNAGTRYSGKYFKLDADINYNGAENNFTPIGTNVKPFCGTFDGSGKTISGLNINLSTTDYVGLFGGTISAIIKGVKLDNSTITGQNDVGGILGSGGSTSTIVQNCAVTSNVSVSGTLDVGGIAGMYATVRGCTSAAAVTGKKEVGGIIGLGQYAAVDHCLYTGSTVTATNGYKGAIIGSKGSHTSLTANYYTQATIGGCNGSDVNGARKAVAIGVADGVTITPTGEVTTYDVSGITAYAGNTILGYDNKLYAGDTESVILSIAATLPEGSSLSGYTDGNGNALTANNDGTYTLTMTDAAPTITVFTDDWGVAGGANGESEETAYVITTAEGLDLLAQKVNAGNEYEDTYFKLGGNITYNRNKENNYTPIGTESHPFRGTFDGQGKTISGLNINLSTTDYVGLFGIINGATIKNVKLDNSTITGKNSVGGIVGYGGSSFTTVENCAVTSNVSVSGYSRVGGIVGKFATVRGCTSAAVVKGDGYYVGGIIGSGDYTTIERCLYTGSSITSTNTENLHIGAITGNEDRTSLTDNYYTQATIGGCDGKDVDGARKAVKISAAEGVTITPTGKATNYDVSGITAYDGNKVLGCAGKFYSNEDEAVKFSIAYTGTPETGYEFSVFNFGENVTVTASENVYTLTVPTSDVTVDVDYQAITYAITYAGVDGATFSGENTEKYTIETATFTLNNPSKEGYVFAGWTYTGQTTPTATVTIAKGSTGDKAYTANWKKLLTNANITVAKIADQTYTGSEIKPAVTVKDGTTDITNQCDITFANNKVVGTATVTIKAKNASANYTGEITTTTFKITPKTVSKPTITLSGTSFEYTGEAIKPTVTVKDGETTIPAEEYTVGYSNNIEAGTATVTITDKEGGNYTVSGSETFEITLTGDINGDKVVNVADIVKAINEGQSQEEIEKIENIIMKK